MPDDFLAAAYNEAMAVYGSEMADAQGELLRAQAAGDTYSAAKATQRMANIRVQAQEYDRMAREHVASQRPPSVDRRTDVDLTPTEAMRVAGLDPNNSDDVEVYNRGVQRLSRLKAQGMYRE